jgi:hypothetical protein
MAAGACKLSFFTDLFTDGIGMGKGKGKGRGNDELRCERHSRTIRGIAACFCARSSLFRPVFGEWTTHAARGRFAGNSGLAPVGFARCVDHSRRARSIRRQFWSRACWLPAVNRPLAPKVGDRPSSAWSIDHSFAAPRISGRSTTLSAANRPHTQRVVSRPRKATAQGDRARRPRKATAQSDRAKRPRKATAQSDRAKRPRKGQGAGTAIEVVVPRPSLSPATSLSEP